MCSGFVKNWCSGDLKHVKAKATVQSERAFLASVSSKTH